MAVLITLLEQHLDRQPTLAVTQATCVCQAGVHLPVKVYTLLKKVNLVSSALGFSFGVRARTEMKI